MFKLVMTVIAALSAPVVTLLVVASGTAKLDIILGFMLVTLWATLPDVEFNITLEKIITVVMLLGDITSATIMALYPQYHIEFQALIMGLMYSVHFSLCAIYLMVLFKGR